MIRIRPLTLILVPTLALGISACDDGTSPADLHGLDPSAVGSAVDALHAQLQASNEAVTNLASARPDLAAAGLDLDWSAESTVQFPEEVTGSTFVFDASEQSWVIDEARTEAPSDGVRVFWYPLDSTGRVIDATESGYIDIQPADVAGTAPIAIRVVEFGDDQTPLLDFTQDYSWTGNGDEVESFWAEGSYTSGESLVDFSLASETSTTATGDMDYSYTSVMEDADTRYVLTGEGMTNGTTGDYEDAITATVERGGATTVLEVQFQGVDNTQEDADGSVRHDGTTVALIDVRAGGYSFTTPDGGDLAATQSSALNSLFQSVTLNGFLLLYELPLFFPTE